MFGFLIIAQKIQILSIVICSAQAFLVSRFTNPLRTFTSKHSVIDAYTTSYVSSSAQFQKSNAKNASIYFERVQIGGEAVLNKPVLLFLPGLDGRGDYSSNVSHTDSFMQLFLFSNGQN